MPTQRVLAWFSRILASQWTFPDAVASPLRSGRVRADSIAREKRPEIGRRESGKSAEPSIGTPARSGSAAGT